MNQDEVKQLVTGSGGVIHAKFPPGQIIATPGAIEKFDLLVANGQREQPVASAAARDPLRA